MLSNVFLSNRLLFNKVLDGFKKGEVCLWVSTVKQTQHTFMIPAKRTEFDVNPTLASGWLIFTVHTHMRMH